MGSFLRFILTLFLIYVGFVVVTAVLSVLIKAALFLVIIAAAYYLYHKATRERFRRYFK